MQKSFFFFFKLFVCFSATLNPTANFTRGKYFIQQPRLLITIIPQHILYHVIHSFYLIIVFEIIRRAHIQLCSYRLEQGLPKHGRKLCITVTLMIRLGSPCYLTTSFIKVFVMSEIELVFDRHKVSYLC